MASSTFSITYNRSEIFTNAHEIKAAKGVTFAVALKMSWAIAKAKALKAALKLGVVAFCFLNKEGVNRPALGTMNEDLFVYSYKTDGNLQSNTTEFAGLVKFWDMESNGWRSCRIDRLLKVGKITVYESYFAASVEDVNIYKQAA